MVRTATGSTVDTARKVNIDIARSLPDLPHRLSIVLLLAILLGAFWLYTDQIASIPPGNASDSIGALADALRISRGVPFHGAFGFASLLAGRSDDSEPLYRYLLAGWFVLVGPGVFTMQIMHSFINLLTVCLTYRMALYLLAHRPWRRLGALVATTVIASNMLLLYVNRTPWRHVLIPIAILIPALLFWRAYHGHGQKWRWIFTGFAAGMGSHVHQSGTFISLWIGGLLVYQLVAAPYDRRARWRNLGLALVGLVPPLAAWIGLLVLIPGLYFRVQQLASGTPLLERLPTGILSSFQAYFFQGHPIWTSSFNLAYAPMLSPVLALLTLIGIGLALWHWRRTESLLLLSGLFCFTLPGVLSGDPQQALHLIGAVPMLALLAGWGAAGVGSGIMWLVSRVNRFFQLQYAARIGLVAALVAMIPLTIVQTNRTYTWLFTDPAHYQDPAQPSNVPNLNTVAFTDAMKALAQVDRPTYVPMWLLDNPAGAFYLQRRAFPNTTTWARYGLKELPPGQFFMPVYWYYHMPAQDDSNHMRVLLLPQEHTLILLPPLDFPPSIADGLPEPGEPGVAELTNSRGWVIARTRPVNPTDVVAVALPPVPDVESTPTIGSGLHVLTPQSVTRVQPGQPAHVLVEWLVTARQPADLGSVTQLIRSDLRAINGSDHWILPYLYPSAYWQPGDIVPDWHEISIPADLPDGVYRWGAGVYVEPRVNRLPVSASDGKHGLQLPDMWLWGGTRQPFPALNTPLPADATAVKIKLGDQIQLEGFRLVQQGTRWDVTLFWRALKAPTDEYTVFVHAAQNRQLVAQADQKPQVPTWAWQPGELVTTTYQLTPPDGADSLYVGMYNYPFLERLPIIQDDRPIADGRALLWKQP